MRRTAVAAPGVEPATPIEPHKNRVIPPDTAYVRLGETAPAVALDGLDRRLDLALRDGPGTMVVDLSEVAHVSSTTIAALLWIKRRCSARAIEVLLLGPSRRSLDTLERVGLLGELTVDATDGSDRLWGLIHPPRRSKRS